MTPLTCPKCQGDMRTYERNGITVDQCADCRGIFLDRGELEHLVEADARAHTTVGSPSAPPAADPRYSVGRHGGDDRYERHDRDDDHRSGYGHQKKRRKSWVDELFD